MLDLLLDRRSIRKFKGQKIERDLIDTIIQGALTAPSGKNTQPWNLVVVDDKEKLNELGSLRDGASKPISEAPLAIVVIGAPEVTDTLIEDCTIIANIIQLMSKSLGLASCWIQVRNRIALDDNTVESNVRAILDIPHTYNVESIIAIGYPDEEKPAHDLKELRYDKVKYNSFLNNK